MRTGEERGGVGCPSRTHGTATVDAVLKIFRGAKVVVMDEPSLLVASRTFVPCQHCTKDAKQNPKKELQVITTRYNDYGERVGRRVRVEKYSPKWRNGKIVEVVLPNGRRRLQCHYCGREREK
jgi:hypothetical protein